VTIRGWFRAVCDDALARGGLDGLGAAVSSYFAEPEDDEDLR
jgi:hypothetical protein